MTYNATIHTPLSGESRVLHGLHHEWAAALWVLPIRLVPRMRPPLFRLADLTGSWGYWSGQRREIVLSRRLVTQHSWDAVREVLVHEMAHQLADELLGARGETSHGPSFLKACDLLRANPRASGDFLPLDRRIAGDSFQTMEDRVTRRVEKLLALAGSPNRHEAEAAMARAHEMAARHNLDDIASKAERDFETAFIGRPALRHPREACHLASLLQEFYFVRVIWTPAWVVEKDRMGRVLEASGTVPNVRMAGYVYDYVKNFTRAEWEEYRNARGIGRHGRRRETDFAIGVVEGFRAKLSQACAGQGPVGREIVPVEDSQLSAYFRRRYPRIRRSAATARLQDDEVREEGVARGRAMILRRGIEGDGMDRGNGGLIAMGD